VRARICVMPCVVAADAAFRRLLILASRPAAVRELAPPGDLATAAQKPLPFEFRNVEMQYDSYRGTQVRCRFVQPSGSALGSFQRKQWHLLHAGAERLLAGSRAGGLAAAWHCTWQ
jgi:hypothetical protein